MNNAGAARYNDHPPRPGKPHPPHVISDGIRPMDFPKLFSRIICIALLVATGAAAAPAPRKHVQIMVEDAASPWSNHAGEGYANDLVRAAFAAAGVDADLVVVPYSRCKALVMQGGAVACFSMAAAAEFDKLVRFADKPLFSVTPQFYYNVKHKVAARSVADLRRGMRVGIVLGYEYPKFLGDLARRGVVIDTARSDVTNLHKLAAGRIDLALVMTDEMRTAELIKRQAGVHGITLAFQEAPQGSFIGFSTTHPEGEIQRQRFNAGFRLITENGTRQAIQAKWKVRCAKYCPE
jgi:ABC-type amino acid transport substrate-binding protein